LAGTATCGSIYSLSNAALILWIASLLILAILEIADLSIRLVSPANSFS